MPCLVLEESGRMGHHPIILNRIHSPNGGVDLPKNSGSVSWHQSFYAELGHEGDYLLQDFRPVFRFQPFTV